MRIIGGLLLFILSAAFTARVVLSHQYKMATREVCELVDEKYFRRDEAEVRDFVARCRELARSQSFLPSKAANIARINYLLSMIRTSHLSVYNPDENRQMWENQGLESGVRSRGVDGFVVIHRVIPGSPAARAGLLPGDVVVSIDGEAVPTPWYAQNGSGDFEIERRAAAKTLHFKIKAEVVAEDMFPTLKDLGKGVALLRIPSFLGTYFDQEKWKSLIRRLVPFRAVVIDLRENAGGSFPAMLRALSPFRCDDRFVGSLYRSAREGEDILKDNLDPDSQLGQLNRVAALHLKTFAEYGCFKGSAAVLIDNVSSSVTEIFAEAFLHRPRSRVLGLSTAGQVVMAQWIPVQAFGGDGYQVSVPVAGFRTAKGERLEDVGVRPQQYLEYDLSRLLGGRDTWVEDAVSLISK